MGSFDRGNNRGGGRSFGGGRGFGGPRRDFGPRSDRPLFKTTCSNCGRECEVPFRPTNGKPVYCSDCFENLGRGKQNMERNDRQDQRAPAAGINPSQIEAINTKLDKIIRLLETKNEVPQVPSAVIEEIKEEITPKTKKSSKKSK